MSENNINSRPDGTPVVVRGRLTKIDAEKFKDAPILGIEIGIEFDSVVANGKFLEIKFTYHALYREEVGRISMSGFLLFEMDEVTSKRIADKFAKDREFDPAIGNAIVNNINYKCSTEAIFPAKIIELTAPIVPPRVGLRKAPAQQPNEPAGNTQTISKPLGKAPTPAPEPPPAEKFTPAPTKSYDARKDSGLNKPFPFPPGAPPPFKS